MADVVDTLVLRNNPREYAARWTNVSDATGESAVVKIDISTLTGPNGRAPTAVKIEEMRWNIQGFNSVRLFWDHTTDDEIAVLSGVGAVDYGPLSGLMDPRSTGGTGDVLLTTNGAAVGNTYDIAIRVRLKD